MSDDVVSSKAFPQLDVAIESVMLLLKLERVSEYDDEEAHPEKLAVSVIESAVLLLELEKVSEYDDEEAHPEELAVSVFNGVASIDVFSSSFTLDAINFSSVPHIEGAQQ